MSKKITHKEVEKAIDKHTWLTGKLADWSGHDWSDLEEEYDFIKNENIIIKYIYQQEKLLELYKQIALLWERRYEYTNSVGEREKLWKIVKELENE